MRYVFAGGDARTLPGLTLAMRRLRFGTVITLWDAMKHVVDFWPWQFYLTLSAPGGIVWVEDVLVCTLLVCP